MLSSPSPAYVVIAEFTAKAGRFEALVAAAKADAAGSVTEPGCRQFDAVAPEGRPGSVVLYEVYDGRAAFEAHQRTTHYATFREAIGDLIAGDPDVRLCARLC